MSQIFKSSANATARVSIILALVGFSAGMGGALFELIADSTYATRQGDAREQPIPFSHAHHVGSMGIDCRYCHTSVDNSDFAVIPPTKTCMNCHSQIWIDSPTLEPVRESYRTNAFDPLDQGSRSSRFRLFQPQHSREEGRRLRNLPRPHRQDAADVSECRRCRCAGASTVTAIPRSIVRPREIRSRQWATSPPSRRKNSARGS